MIIKSFRLCFDIIFLKLLLMQKKSIVIAVITNMRKLSNQEPMGELGITVIVKIGNKIQAKTYFIFAVLSLYNMKPNAEGK